MSESRAVTSPLRGVLPGVLTGHCHPGWSDISKAPNCQLSVSGGPTSCCHAAQTAGEQRGRPGPGALPAALPAERLQEARRQPPVRDPRPALKDARAVFSGERACLPLKSVWSLRWRPVCFHLFPHHPVAFKLKHRLIKLFFTFNFSVFCLFFSHTCGMWKFPGQRAKPPRQRPEPLQ